MVAIWVHIAVVTLYAQLTVGMPKTSVLELFPTFKQLLNNYKHLEGKLQTLRAVSGDCKTTVKGKEYNGAAHLTISGRTCQRWDSQSPHTSKHKNEDMNYCRNPDGEPEGPWCYTTDPNKRWEYCDVPMCVLDSKPKVVAFYAYLGSHENYKKPGRIKFNVVGSNEGGGYSDGIFTVPKGKGGVYVFSWTIASSYGGWVNTELRVNSKNIANTLANMEDKNDVRVVTGVVVTKVNDGDRVYIQLLRDGYIFSGAFQKSSFSGWKLN